jgi:hypothetical protein
MFLLCTRWISQSTASIFSRERARPPAWAGIDERPGAVAVLRDQVFPLTERRYSTGRAQSQPGRRPSRSNGYLRARRLCRRTGRGRDGYSHRRCSGNAHRRRMRLSMSSSSTMLPRRAQRRLMSSRERGRPADDRGGGAVRR